jgi:hypothetical protein
MLLLVQEPECRIVESDSEPTFEIVFAKVISIVNFNFEHFMPSLDVEGADLIPNRIQVLVDMLGLVKLLAHFEHDIRV